MNWLSTQAVAYVPPFVGSPYINKGGIDLLFEEKRGGDMWSQFDKQNHTQLAQNYPILLMLLPTIMRSERGLKKK